MADCIPEDIVKEILLRVDPKSIGKCKAVCKSWNFLIKSHHFLSSYQPRTRLFLVRPSNHELCLCSPQNIEYSYVPLSDFALDEDYEFVGAVKGLVCLSSYDPRIHSHLNFILLNPLTRRSLQLPISKTLRRSCCCKLWYGFGFDSKKNDFKVLQMSSVHFKLPPKVELYSLNEGAWRVLNTPFDQDFFNYWDYRRGNQLFFHDSVHWLVCRHGLHSPKNYHIVMFNVVEEKFSKMEDLPQVLAWSYRKKLSITVIDGCLSVVEYPQQPGDNTNIWMKREEESWSKIYSLSLSGGNIRKLLGQSMSMSSQVLVLLSPYTVDYSYGEIKSLHSYDLKSQEMRDLGIKSRFMSLCASDFTYSLIMLDKESNADVSVWVSPDEGESSGEGESSSDEGESSSDEGESSSDEGESPIFFKKFGSYLLRRITNIFSKIWILLTI